MRCPHIWLQAKAKAQIEAEKVKTENARAVPCYRTHKPAPIAPLLKHTKYTHHANTHTAHHTFDCRLRLKLKLKLKKQRWKQLRWSLVITLTNQLRPHLFLNICTPRRYTQSTPHTYTHIHTFDGRLRQVEAEKAKMEAAKVVLFYRTHKPAPTAPLLKHVHTHTQLVLRRALQHPACLLSMTTVPAADCCVSGRWRIK